MLESTSHVPFDFQPRTRVVFGHGAVDRVGDLAAELGFRRRLVVADPASSRPDTRRVCLALPRIGSRYTLTSDVGVNPDSDMVAARRRVCRAAERRLDRGARRRQLARLREGNQLSADQRRQHGDYRGYGKATTPLLPMIGIPTTAGTGSEAQSYAVIADAATHMKMACGDPSAAFRVAILDPDLTISAPRPVTAVAGFDAIAHAVETWVTNASDARSRTCSPNARGRCSAAHTSAFWPHPDDRAARAAMTLGAHFAGMAIEQSMLGAAHACANPLTARFDVPHGLALAMLLPHVVRWNAPSARERYAELLCQRRRGATPCRNAGGRLEELTSAGGLRSTLTDAGVTADSIPELAALAAQQWTGTFNPRPFDASGAEAIYRAAYVESGARLGPGTRNRLGTQHERSACLTREPVTGNGDW